MYLTCSVSFTINDVNRIICNGSIVESDNFDQTLNNAYCDVPFSTSYNTLTCEGVFDTELVNNPYLFNLSSYNFTNKKIKDVTGLQTFTSSIVQNVGSVSNGVLSLSTADYSAMLGLSLTPLALAWGFNLLTKLILNR